ncbi:hypothetical protein [Chitinophaga sp. XS-30]|uniref:hypothetical protein n=1 Tax=Chitinophaga sp. XS-30 TaxID=2604421 RepID=UPI0011DCBC57|nr:hypothetical protein [Chitinophaga sp. XS-30]QEH43122.1 hypothetical protein FW415_20525 [Chitinophaga sp. XS-30]
MTANRIIHHIFNQPDLRQVDQAELERLVETYPYFAAARLLLAQKQYSEQQDLTAPAMKKAQLYSSSPQQLYQLLTGPVAEEGSMAHTQASDTVSEELIEAAEEEIEEYDTLTHEIVEDETLAERTEIVEDHVETESASVNTVSEELIDAAEEEIEEYDTLTHEIIEDETLAERTEIVEDPAETGNTSAETVSEELIDAAEEEIEEYDTLTHEIVEDETLAERTEIVEDPVETESTSAETVSEELIDAAEEEIEEEDSAEARDMTEVATEDHEEEEQDEVIAVDYEPIKEQEAAELADEILGETKDEIVAVDYEPIKEQEATELADEILGETKDEIIAVDYEPIKQQEATELADEILGETKDEIVAVDYEPIKQQEAAELAEEEPHFRPAYEPEIEEEEIVLTADTEPEGLAAAGLTLPGIAEEGASGENEGPIRIHPMDTPAEETTLTFQPLYTDDYFAYKKLKEPNNAEAMNEKAQAEMRSFTDWLRELKDNFTAGKNTRNWYQQQMHRLYEDEEPEVSETVEKMAMESITFNNDIVSETLAEIWVRQHQHAKAIDIYQKLSLLNPDKNAYFAQKIKALQSLTDNNK